MNLTIPLMILMCAIKISSLWDFLNCDTYYLLPKSGPYRDFDELYEKITFNSLVLNCPVGIIFI